MSSMPPVVKNLLIINVLCFAAIWVAELYGINLNALLGLYFFAHERFHLYQLLTYMFMHGSLQHLFFNMFAVWMFGRIMESQMGSQRFLFFYLVCGIGAGLVQEVAQLVEFSMGYWSMAPTVGASGAVYGILLSFGMTFPEERMFIFPLPVPIKAKYFVIGYALIELFAAMGNPGDGVAHMAHLGGMLFGYLIIRYWRRGNGGGRGNYYDPYDSSDEDRWGGFRRWFERRRKKSPTFTVIKGEGYNKDMQY
ncbi:MAG: rhomboid family intramembrane serine protease, partial [Bacteroidaceae bacterium]|nr:rhomboid family intramembrane serine protease [Bacteroidaceae bacterium]